MKPAKIVSLPIFKPLAVTLPPLATVRLPVPELPTVKIPAMLHSEFVSVTKIFPVALAPSPMIPKEEVARVKPPSMVNNVAFVLLLSFPTVRAFVAASAVEIIGWVPVVSMTVFNVALGNPLDQFVTSFHSLLVVPVQSVATVARAVEKKMEPNPKVRVNTADGTSICRRARQRRKFGVLKARRKTIENWARRFSGSMVGRQKHLHPITMG